MHKHKWTHLLCDDCYNEEEPERTPTRLKEGFREKDGTCCRCGEITNSGIYYRKAPGVYKYCPGDEQVMVAV